MSDGLKDILEIEYDKAKEKKNTIDFSSLLEMVERAYDTIGVEIVGEAKEGKDAVSTEKKETETINIALPFVQLSEAWGKPGSAQRSDVAKFIDQMGAPVIPGNPVETLRNRLRQLQSFTTTILEGSLASGEGMLVSQVISNILILDSLSSIVTAGEEEQYSASPAGFIFEGFLAALAGGDSTQVKPKESVSTEDITIDLGTDAGGVPVSLKLLRRAGKVHGSISDLVHSFKGQAGVDLQQMYSIKKGPSVPAEESLPRTDEAVGRRAGAQPGAAALDKDVNGMKYIIVLKTPKESGTLLDFYEFDFTLEKFQKWVEDGVIAKPGTGTTQFSIGLKQYLNGPFPGGGATEIAQSYVLPGSLEVRLKAQKVLKDLYNDFYKILEALKTTTDSLNTYLANPEDKPAGRSSAIAADGLEKDITKTTTK